MGTRHLVAVASEGEYRIAQYGQWNGYPSGQGTTALAFARACLATPEQIASFRAKLKLCQFITDKQVDALYEKEGVEVKNGMIEIRASKKFGERYPSLSRDTGAEILALVAKATDTVPLTNAISFARESLFCEWAYVLDLDTETFEVFKGFQKAPAPEGERFTDIVPEGADEFNIDTPAPPARPRDEYRSVHLLAKFPLNALPTDEQFLALENEEESD